MHFLRRLSLPGSNSGKSTSSKSLHTDITVTAAPPSPPHSPVMACSPAGSPTTPRAPSPATFEAPSAGIKRTDNRLRRLSLILRRATSKRTKSGDQSTLAVGGATTASGDSADSAASAVSRSPVLGTTSEEPEEETPEGELPDGVPLADSQWTKSTISV